MVLKNFSIFVCLFVVNECKDIEKFLHTQDFLEKSPQKYFNFMEATVKERLIRFIKAEGLSVRRFEMLTGLSNGFVKNMSKGLGADKLRSILQVFPQLNSTWLLTGEGEMLVSDLNGGSRISVGDITAKASGNGRATATVGIGENEQGNTKDVQELKQQINEFRRQIDELKAQNARLLGIIEKLTSNL